MIIKKFTAPTMTEALAKVRDELGTDAVILNTRSNRRGGVFDFMGQAVVEVTAAVDEKEARTTPSPTATGPARRRANPIGPAEAKQYPPAPPVSYEPAGKRWTPAEINVQEVNERIEISKVVSDITELKRAVRELADSALSGEMSGLPSNLADLLVNMQDAGLESRLAKRVVRQLLNELNGTELTKRDVILDRAAGLMMERMGEVSPVRFSGSPPRIVAFVGPTGTGKTTTIAKLATDFSLSLGKKVSVLTIDTKRIDAVGQLRIYCRIIDIPLHIAYSPDDLPGIMPRLMKSDVILVDTPGAGPMDRPQMMEMVEFLQRLVPQEVHLTMSVTTSITEMKRISENFGILKPNRVLFTKLDETDRYGPMLSFAVTSGKPLSYVTFGQNVPGDFALADPDSLIRKNFDRKRGDTVAGAERQVAE